MKIFKSLKEWQQCRSNLSNSSIGFVPTMGNLHAGHMALYKQSRLENDISVASIFVNAKQFNNLDDFNNYPQTLEQDLQKLEQAGVDYCLLPNQAEIYPKNYQYRVNETLISQQMEGKCRPGHFDGVLTIVLKLLNLVKANNAYFGEKDYQQYQLIKGMTEAFFMPTKIIPCPIIRDDFGLALSSRNNRLTTKQLAQARNFAKLFHQYQLATPEIKTLLESAKIKVEYIKQYQGRCFAAVFIDDVRLIDNWQIPLNQNFQKLDQTDLS